jgi:integrase
MIRVVPLVSGAFRGVRVTSWPHPLSYSARLARCETEMPSAAAIPSTVDQDGLPSPRSIVRSLSAMVEDAITDEVCDLNPFKGVRIRASDPRAQKKRRPIRVFSFEEMHRFAKAAGPYEALVRTFTDTGMRLGEVLPLRAEDFDGETLQVCRTAHEGVVLDGRRRTTARRALAASSSPRDPRLAT